MTHFTKIIPKSPDPNIILDSDLTTAKVGDVNYIIRILQDAPIYDSQADAVTGGLENGDIYLLHGGVPGSPYTLAVVVL